MQGTSTLGTYTYDSYGNRIKRVEGTSTSLYLNKGVSVIYEKSGNSNLDYVLVGDLLIAKLTSNAEYYFHQDILGGTRLVTKGTQTDFSTNYKPFGPQYGASGVDPAYKYTGQQHDSATSLYYYGARYYDISIGRFLSRDPASPDFSNPQALNPYSYVQNNPEGFTDPTGRATFSGSGYWRARWVVKTALYTLMIAFLYAIWPVVSNPGLASLILAATIPVIVALGNFIALGNRACNHPIWASSMGTFLGLVALGSRWSCMDT